LTAELAVNGPMEIRVNRRLVSPPRERKLSNALNLIADPNASAAEDTFVRVSLKERRDLINRGRFSFPGIAGLLDPIFINQALENTLTFLLTPGTDHGVVEEDELELKFS
jgi:hypothetical protein